MFLERSNYKATNIRKNFLNFKEHIYIFNIDFIKTDLKISSVSAILNINSIFWPNNIRSTLWSFGDYSI